MDAQRELNRGNKVTLLEAKTFHPGRKELHTDGTTPTHCPVHLVAYTVGDDADESGALRFAVPDSPRIVRG